MEIAFDTETTGLSPKEGHRIVEIGCVKMVDYVRSHEPCDEFHCYINPERDMPSAAQRVHGLSAAFLADKPVFADIAAKFVAFVGDATLVAHNAAFDMSFINHELVRAGYPAFPDAQSIDTLRIARQTYPGQPASLDALCRRFGVDLSARTKHGALLDAQLLADMYLELMGGRQTSFGLQDQSDKKEAASSVSHPAHVTFTSRSFPPSEEETAAHRAFIAQHIAHPLWESAHSER
ncbi:MAG: DNA polymerase III subunit epsilon [Sphaerospermopsis sp. SIO1G2]|nr:DNA polymerase III subunit epsilon [Sphaerospermopsis sp. SIO1G2]